MAEQSKLWVVGPLAWDSVVYLDTPIRTGGFSQGKSFEERPGGTGANVARALASAKLPVEFVGYVGSDSYGPALKADLAKRGIGVNCLRELKGPTSHVQIVIEPDGERLILGLAEDRLSKVTLKGAPIKPGDTVVFVLWREHFYPDLLLAKRLGAKVVVGLGAVADARVSADVAIGSIHDLPSGHDFGAALGRFERVVVTQGTRGVDLYSNAAKSAKPKHFAARKVRAVDATGAGDAFLAGYLLGQARGFTDAECVVTGTEWAAETVTLEGSIPAPWSQVTTGKATRKN